MIGHETRGIGGGGNGDRLPTMMRGATMEWARRMGETMVVVLCGRTLGREGEVSTFMYVAPSLIAQPATLCFNSHLTSLASV